MINVYQKVANACSFMQQIWQSIQTLVPLIWVRFKVEWFNLKEYLSVIYRYYHKIGFMKSDVWLLLHYLFQSPYRMNKNFLKKIDEREAGNIDIYGETPLTTLEKITQECEITSKDTVYELGCGRGRTSFWLGEFLSCKAVVGIEYVPEFIAIAKKIKKKCKISRVDFLLADFLQADLSRATVIYLYGTCLDEANIQKFIEHIKNSPSGTKVITVSYPLTEYAKEPIFEVMKCFEGIFPWGTTDIYLQYRK